MVIGELLLLGTIYTVGFSVFIVMLVLFLAGVSLLIGWVLGAFCRMLGFIE